MASPIESPARMASPAPLAPPASEEPLSRRHSTHPSRPRAWAELLRLPALFTVPGDALAGAAAVSARPTPRTLLAIASSLCLYEAGMALNDWADRDVDAVERPHRPLPSGRVHPAAAFTAACAFTGAGLTLAACAGRPALTVAVPLATTIWAYDLALKNTPAGPLAMATARGLDLLLGAAAATGAGSAGRGTLGSVSGSAAAAAAERRAPAPGLSTDLRGAVPLVRSGAGLGLSRALPSPRLRDADQLPRLDIRRALPSAALLGLHTLAVTTVSRRETQGGSHLAPCAALAATAVLTHLLTRQRPPTADATDGSRGGTGSHRPANQATATLRLALATAYATTTARPYLHAALNPSPPLTQQAVTAGIRATIPLQAALTTRSATRTDAATALLTTAFAPLARRFARKVSVT
ncbi:UbiA family prenyltransferase [Streptomyces sp. SID13726]|nr:UbiA family prenyltransferase [Streptomyces sp. SID13726]